MFTWSRIDDVVAAFVEGIEFAAVLLRREELAVRTIAPNDEGSPRRRLLAVARDDRHHVRAGLERHGRGE
jgi:hypothetical protein